MNINSINCKKLKLKLRTLLKNKIYLFILYCNTYYIYILLFVVELKFSSVTVLMITVNKLVAEIFHCLCPGNRFSFSPEAELGMTQSEVICSSCAEAASQSCVGHMP